MVTHTYYLLSLNLQHFYRDSVFKLYFINRLLQRLYRRRIFVLDGISEQPEGN